MGPFPIVNGEQATEDLPARIYASMLPCYCATMHVLACWSYCRTAAVLARANRRTSALTGGGTHPQATAP